MRETHRRLVFLSAGRNSLFVVIIIEEVFCGGFKPIFSLRRDKRQTSPRDGNVIPPCERREGDRL